MLMNMSRTRVVGGWIAAVIVAFALSVVGGGPLTVGTSQLWLLMCVVPSTMLLLLWPGASPLTVAEMLYADDGATKKGGR